ncbi:TetR-like C-terminal domain-containing protein, partial [Ralstonia pseudosolanacearum]|uniref:TetR-like C-terminal domain-containing protein n=1 Tax=Ralstonia pseudosolanacearum TaxID=1310165 RepID=UPI003CF3D8AB
KASLEWWDEHPNQLRYEVQGQPAQVRASALAALARAMEAELARIDPAQPEAEQARAALRAVGVGYLRFAQQETGLFRTAFAVPDEVEHDADPDKAGDSGLNPFQLLGAALDRMTAAGVLPAERRPGAEYLAWSAVHGLALLIIDGPLRGRPPEQTGAIALRVVEMVENGL